MASRIRRLCLFSFVLLAAQTIGWAAMPAPSASAYTSPAIWVGSPIGVNSGRKAAGDSNGVWGTTPFPDTMPSNGHHLLQKAIPVNHWAVDLSRIPAADRAVKLYVAPSNAAYNNRVTTKITQIVENNACRNGGGGDLVGVGIYFDNKLYGHVTFAHLDRASSLYVGRPVERWGSTLGVASDLSADPNDWSGGPACWTGRHVHMELRAQTNRACWNKGYTLGYDLGRSNFVGFISGPLTNTTKACP